MCLENIIQHILKNCLRKCVTFRNTKLTTKPLKCLGSLFKKDFQTANVVGVNLERLNPMDESLEIKRMEREMTVLIVAKELNKFAQEAALAAIDSIGKPEFKIIDAKPWANRIISIVKEHSL